MPIDPNTRDSEERRLEEQVRRGGVRVVGWTPKYWLEGTSDERAIVSQAVEEAIEEAKKCLDDFFPHLRNCMENLWKNKLYGSIENCPDKGTYAWTEIKTDNYGWDPRGITICRRHMPSGTEGSRWLQLKHNMLHELVHACLGTEFDAQVVASLCHPEGRLAPDPIDWDNWSGVWTHLKEKLADFYQPPPLRNLKMSYRFIWDPETGEIWIKETDPFNPQFVKKGRKLPIIFKKP